MTESETPSTVPGAARCPGPSMQDIIARDGGAPDALTTEKYTFLGDADLPLDRVTSRSFHDLEIDRMWSRTWQWACREEHIPSPGDWYVYDVGPYSVLVVRGADQQIRAFVNSCPHRAMQLAPSGACGSGKQFVRCPFHGMSWHLDGSLRDIPCEWDFPHVDPATFGLDAVRCEIWQGFVFINLDDGCEPLATYIGVLDEHFRQFPMTRRYITAHTRKVLPVNWKTAMEAFLEAYHVLATHPEGLKRTGDANAQYDILDTNVSRFMHAIGFPSPHLRTPISEPELFELLGHDPGALPEGASARVEHAEIYRAEMSEALGVDLSGLSVSELLDSIEYFLFPNACFFPGIQVRMVYRFLPIDENSSIHEVLVLDPLPEGQSHPKPPPVLNLDVNDRYADKAPSLVYGPVLDQDTDNFIMQQRGIRASRKGAQTLGNYQEVRIRHVHQRVDDYLSIP